MAQNEHSSPSAKDIQRLDLQNCLPTYARGKTENMWQDEMRDESI